MGTNTTEFSFLFYYVRIFYPKIEKNLKQFVTKEGFEFRRRGRRMPQGKIIVDPNFMQSVLILPSADVWSHQLAHLFCANCSNTDGI